MFLVPTDCPACPRSPVPQLPALCWETAGWAFEDTDQRNGNSSPLLGTLAHKGCLPRPSQLGAWRRVLPPQSRGPGLPAKAAAEPCSCDDHLPSLGMSCFPAQPKLQVGLKINHTKKQKCPESVVLCAVSKGNLSQRLLCLSGSWQRPRRSPYPGDELVRRFPELGRSGERSPGAREGWEGVVQENPGEGDRCRPPAPRPGTVACPRQEE